MQFTWGHAHSEMDAFRPNTVTRWDQPLQLKKAETEPVYVLYTVTWTLERIRLPSLMRLWLQYALHPKHPQAGLAQLAYMQHNLPGDMHTILGGRVAMDPSWFGHIWDVHRITFWLYVWPDCLAPQQLMSFGSVYWGRQQVDSVEEHEVWQGQVRLSMQMGKEASCEDNTMTRPLLLSEILQKGELIGYEHTTRLEQWLSSKIKLRSAHCTGYGQTSLSRAQN